MNSSSQTSSPIQLLQVFNTGRPCGWLGHTSTGYWFHYSSNSPDQHWVSLLMPPSQNFYQQAELFPVFAQHLPRNTTIDAPLNHLQQFNGQHLGALSFANPDNPVVKQPLRTPPNLLPGQSVLVTRQAYKNIADTLVHHESVWPTVQILRAIKKKVDPHNRLYALRWALEADCANGLVWHPRPDFDAYGRQLLGFESLSSVLNLNQLQYFKLLQNAHRLSLVLAELARTYCKNTASEINLAPQLLALLQTGKVEAFIAFRHNNNQQEHPAKPTVFGFEYLPVN